MKSEPVMDVCLGQIEPDQKSKQTLDIEIKACPDGTKKKKKEICGISNNYFSMSMNTQCLVGTQWMLVTVNGGREGERETSLLLCPPER